MSEKQLSIPKLSSGGSFPLSGARKVSFEEGRRMQTLSEVVAQSEASNETHVQALNRLFSINSVISTSSSFAERQQRAIGREETFRVIGVGSVGKIFEHPGTKWVYKLPLVESSNSLWNNYVMHTRIQDSFDKLGELGSAIEIPRIGWFADNKSEFWPDHLHRFPNEQTFTRKPRQALCMERIFPIPEPIRILLIDLWCPEALGDTANASQSNKDCLLRLLLGKNRFVNPRPGGQYVL